MALINCPECGKEISDRASACPNCGCPVEHKAPVAEKVPYTELGKIFKKTRKVYIVSIDDANRLWKATIFGNPLCFEDVIGVEIYENDRSVSKAGTGSMLGRAAVGTVLAGPVGMVIGGVTGKKKSIEIVNKMQVIVSTKDVKRPRIAIDIIMPKKTKKDSRDYNKAIATAQEVEAVFRAMMAS